MGNVGFKTKLGIADIDSTGISAGLCLISNGAGGWGSQDSYTKPEANAEFWSREEDYAAGPVTITTSYTDILAVTVNVPSATDIVVVRFTGFVHIGHVVTGTGMHTFGVSLRYDRNGNNIYTQGYYVRGDVYVPDGETAILHQGLSVVQRATGLTGSQTFKLQLLEVDDYDVSEAYNIHGIAAVYPT